MLSLRSVSAAPGEGPAPETASRVRRPQHRLDVAAPCARVRRCGCFLAAVEYEENESDQFLEVPRVTLRRRRRRKSWIFPPSRADGDVEQLVLGSTTEVDPRPAHLQQYRACMATIRCWSGRAGKLWLRLGRDIV